VDTGLAVERMRSGTAQVRSEMQEVTRAHFARLGILERWLGQIKTKVSLRSWERYAEIVHNNIVPALGAVQLTRLRPKHISEGYSKALTGGRREGAGGLSPQTVHHMHTI
jgi:Phage integrase, N-terminal SAM-like domain